MHPSRWRRAGWSLTLAVTLSGLLIRHTASLDLTEITTLFNPNCVTFTILGPCLCGYPPTPSCVQVGYWEPAYLIETVKVPGDTTLAPLTTLLQTLTPSFTLGSGGSGNTSSDGRTNLHYSESHVATFPLPLSGPCTGCQSQLTIRVHYVTEIDPLWRVGIGIPDLAGFFGRGELGVWGLLYPRAGWAIHSSPAVASGIAAARAMDVAARPTGEPTHPEQRIVLQQTPDHPVCLQLATPRITECFRQGRVPSRWEHDTVSTDGQYLWVFWRYRTCCVYPSDTACGFTLGGAGANRCLEP